MSSFNTKTTSEVTQPTIFGEATLQGMPAEVTNMIFKLCDLSCPQTPSGWGPVPALIVALGCSKSALHKQALEMLFATNTLKISMNNQWCLEGLSSFAMSSVRSIEFELSNLLPEVVVPNNPGQHIRTIQGFPKPSDMTSTLRRCPGLSEVTLRFTSTPTTSPGVLSLAAFRTHFPEWLAGCQYVKLVNIFIREQYTRLSFGSAHASLLFSKNMHPDTTDPPQSFTDIVATVSSNLRVQDHLVSESGSITSGTFCFLQTEHWQWKAARGEVMNWSMFEDLAKIETPLALESR